MVPASVADLDKAGAVQEVMCCQAYKKMLPAYIEDAMMTKIARNNESGEAIQIIFDTRAYDLGKLYLEGTLTGNLSGPLKSGKSVIPDLEAKREKIDLSLQKIIDELKTTEG